MRPFFPITLTMALLGTVAAAQSSRTRPHRMDVVVDKKATDGKAKAAAPAPGSTGRIDHLDWLDFPGGVRGGGMPDIEALMREELRRAGFDGDIPHKTENSSHVRRVVVHNGRTVVDEELRNGVPVHRGIDRPDAGVGDGVARAAASASSSSHDSSSSSSRDSSSDRDRAASDRRGGELRDLRDRPAGDRPLRDSRDRPAGDRPRRDRDHATDAHLAAPRDVQPPLRLRPKRDRRDG